MKNDGLSPFHLTALAASLAAGSTSQQTAPLTVTPPREGTRRAKLREAERAVQVAELYAETPMHPPTRQRQRWLEKPWRPHWRQ